MTTSPPATVQLMRLRQGRDDTVACVKSDKFLVLSNKNEFPDYEH